MEANWMKAIPSSTICNFFYFFFVLYALILSLAVLGFVGIAVIPRLSKALSVPNTLGLALSIAVAGTQMLFFYLICSRSLLEVTKTREGFFVEAKKPTEEDEEKKEAFEDMKKIVDAAKKGVAPSRM
jgi:hypothetical protein